MKKIGFCLLMLCAVIFMGYAASPVVNIFMDPEIPIADHAVVSVHNNLLITKLDGQVTTKVSGKGNEGWIMVKEPMVFITPGVHTMVVSYMKVATNFDTDYRGTTTMSIETTESGLVTISGTFEGGHFYRIFPMINGKNISFRIIDETDPSAWNEVMRSEVKKAQNRVAAAKKAQTTVKYPSKVLLVTLFQRAAAAAPTILEGTYVMKDNPDFARQGITKASYTFKGNTMTFVETRVMSDAQFKQENNVRKAYKLGPPLSSKIRDSGSRGTFDISGNIISFKMLQTGNDEEGWTSMEMEEQKGIIGRMTNKAVRNHNEMLEDSAVTTYGFSLNAAGELLLNTHGGPPQVYVKENKK